MNQKLPKLFKAKGRIATDILGRSKYTTYEEALNESIANSMDWEATEIRIKLDKNKLEIIDNGTGMTEKILEERFFGLGEKNIDPAKKGQFGIGICANAALGNILSVETKSRKVKFGTKVKINFSKLEDNYLGDYEPEYWINNSHFPNFDHGTIVRIEDLRWRNINEEGIINYLQDKHWPALIDPEIKFSIFVNDKKLYVKEPEYEQKFEFNSSIRFRLGRKQVPPMPNLECGTIKGTFYIMDNCEQPSIDIYVKNQRLDAYSGDKVDWLNIKDLRSPKGFQADLKGVIKVEAENKTEEEELDPLIHIKGTGLMLKSDRSRFFENTKSFEQLCAYLNEKSKGPILHLPNGGLLRLIHDRWYKDKASNFDKNISIVDKAIEDIKPEISKILKGAEAFRRISQEGEEKLKPRKKEKNSHEGAKKPVNKMLQCKDCGKITRIPIEVIKKWQLSDSNGKSKIEEKIKCMSCGKKLHPIDDAYKKESPIATSGKELAKIDLGIGQLKTLKADIMGERGPRAIYNIEEEIIKLNVQHALLVYSLKQGPEALKANLIDSTIFAVALEISQENSDDFQKVYNNLSINISRLVDETAFDDALDKFI